MPTRPRRSPDETQFLVVWWMQKTPHAAVFRNRIAADAAARVRNALLIEFSGDDVQVEGVLDFYRRDEEDRPMPAEWRDLAGQIRVPWARESGETEALA